MRRGQRSASLGQVQETGLRVASYLVVVALTVVACGESAPRMDAHVNLSEEAGTTRGEFACKQSSSDGCEFTVFVENCEEPKQGSACTREVLQSFTLKSGSSRVIDRLPLGARYCVKGQGSSAEPVCPPVPSPPPPQKRAPQTAASTASGATAA